MNKATLRIISKIEVELKEAQKKMKRFEDDIYLCGSQMHYNYWKKEVLEHLKELKDIKTGRVIY